MKKFSKLFLSCAAVAAVTAAVATSAMAAGEISATYTAAGENATAKLTIDASGYTAAQKTLLVLKPGKTLETVKVTEGDVLQIDQKDGNDSIAVALPKNLADGVYNVYMGGDGKTYNTTFTVGNVSSRLLGDADGNDTINVMDASAVANHFVKIETLTGDSLQAADADDNGTINVMDASEIANYFVHLPSNVDGVKTIADKKNTVQ